MPTDRLKTDEEILREEKEKLEDLEVSTIVQGNEKGIWFNVSGYLLN